MTSSPLDKYSCFAELRRSEPATAFKIDHHVCGDGTGVVVIAPHGGKIEPLTTEIAHRVSKNLGLSFYSFIGQKPQGQNRDLHITSTNWDEPVGLAMVQSSRSAIAMHGCKDQSSEVSGAAPVSRVFVGGGNRELARMMATQIFPSRGFDAEFAEVKFAGKQPTNIVNRGKQPGLQLEMTMRFRMEIVEDQLKAEAFDECMKVAADFLSS